MIANEVRDDQLERGSFSQLSSSNLRIPNRPLREDIESFELNLVDLRHSFKSMSKNYEIGRKAQVKLSTQLRIAYSNDTNRLILECNNPDLMVDLVQSLVIDRLKFELSRDKSQPGLVVVDLRPIQDELNEMDENLRELEESERRIQSELYESADYAQNLIQQFTIANQLNEL